MAPQSVTLVRRGADGGFCFRVKAEVLDRRRIVGGMKASRVVKLILMPWSAGRVAREEEAELRRYGAVPIPGEATVALPAGEIRISYRESTKAPTHEVGAAFAAPESLEISIRPAAGGPPVDIDTDAQFDSFTIGARNVRPALSVTGVGRVEVAAAGDYVVTARVDPTGLTQPHLLLG